MKKYVLALTSLVFIAVGCQKKSKESLPSIKSDYKEKTEFVLAMLSQPSTMSFDDSAHRLVLDKLYELKNLIPLSGLTVRKKADSLQLPDAVSGVLNSWTLIDGPAYRIESVKGWVLCSAPTQLYRVNFNAGTNSLSYSTYVDPQITNSYIIAGPTFDYNGHQPQYEFYPNTVVGSGVILYYGSNLSGCTRIRTVIEYTGYDNRVVEAIVALRSQISEVIGMLEDLKDNRNKSGYPIAYQMKLVTEKLQNAYNALP